MAILESLILGTSGAVELNGSVWGLEQLDMTPPAKRQEWAQAADADGALLVRTPLYENRTVTATVRLNPQATMDLALTKLAQVIEQLQEADVTPGGIELVWTPAESTKTIKFWVLSGSVNGIPITMDGADAGYFARAPKLAIAMTCKPFGYGTEVQGTAAHENETGLSVAIVTIATCPGDVPAEGRLVVKDTTGTIGRRFVEWGIEQRYYNNANGLILDSEDMSAVGGAKATLTGAYKRAGATWGVISTTLFGNRTICANTGILKHVGVYRVKARVFLEVGSGVPGNVNVRLSYRDGESPMRGNEWVSTNTVGKFVEVDLGTITLTKAIRGTQGWLGQIEAFSTNAPGSDILHIDYLTFIPVAEGYGKARAPTSTEGGTLNAVDTFTTGVLSGNLGGRTAPLGGVWATSGETTDLVVTTGSVTRQTTTDTAPRFAVFGSSLTNSSGAISVTAPLTTKLGQESHFKVRSILRWVSATEYAYLELQTTIKGEYIAALKLETLQRRQKLILGYNEAGTLRILASAEYTPQPSGTPNTYNLQASLYPAVYADGTFRGVCYVGGVGVLSLAGQSAVLATGGLLASGKGGFADWNYKTGEGTPKRTYTEPSVTAAPAIPYLVQPSRQMEVRSDTTLADDSSGTYAGVVPVYRGSRFYVPADGVEGRTSRIIVKADRNDLAESDQNTIGDAFTIQPFITPRYLVVPR